MGLVISGLQRAKVLAAFQVRGGMCSHPHRHQVRSGCSLSPFYGGQQRASHFPASQSRHGTAGILPGPQDSVQSRCQMLGNPSQRVCAHVCCQVLKPEEARASGRATPSSLLCPHFPQVGGCVGDPGFRTQQQTGGQQGLACSVAPSFTPPPESGCV